MDALFIQGIFDSSRKNLWTPENFADLGRVLRSMRPSTGSGLSRLRRIAHGFYDTPLRTTGSWGSPLSEIHAMD